MHLHSLLSTLTSAAAVNASVIGLQEFDHGGQLIQKATSIESLSLNSEDEIVSLLERGIGDLFPTGIIPTGIIPTGIIPKLSPTDGVSVQATQQSQKTYLVSLKFPASILNSAFKLTASVDSGLNFDLETSLLKIGDQSIFPSVGLSVSNKVIIIVPPLPLFTDVEVNLLLVAEVSVAKLEIGISIDQILGLAVNDTLNYNVKIDASDPNILKANIDAGAIVVPTTTDAPVETDIPSTTDAPIITDAPVDTDVSVETDVPATTDAPVETDVPATTDAPVDTDIPTTTNAPVDTDISTTADVPLETDAPTNTKNPVDTDVPGETGTITDPLPPAPTSLTGSVGFVSQNMLSLKFSLPGDFSSNSFELTGIASADFGFEGSLNSVSNVGGSQVEVSDQSSSNELALIVNDVSGIPVNDYQISLGINIHTTFQTQIVNQETPNLTFVLGVNRKGKIVKRDIQRFVFAINLDPSAPTVDIRVVDPNTPPNTTGSNSNSQATTTSTKPASEQQSSTTAPSTGRFTTSIVTCTECELQGTLVVYDLEYITNADGVTVSTKYSPLTAPSDVVTTNDIVQSPSVIITEVAPGVFSVYTTLVPVSTVAPTDTRTDIVQSTVTETSTGLLTTVITTCPSCDVKTTVVGVTTVTTTSESVTTTYTTYCPVDKKTDVTYIQHGTPVTPSAIIVEVTSGVYSVQTVFVPVESATKQPHSKPTNIVHTSEQTVNYQETDNATTLVTTVVNNPTSSPGSPGSPGSSGSSSNPENFSIKSTSTADVNVNFVGSANRGPAASGILGILMMFVTFMV